MTEQVTQILTPVALAVLTALGSVTVYAVKVMADKAKMSISAIENDAYRNDTTAVLEFAEKTIGVAVLETNQLLVDNMKAASADGKLTETEIKVAFEQTYSKVKILLGEQICKELEEVLPDLKTWITSNIEAAVADSK